MISVSPESCVATMDHIERVISPEKDLQSVIVLSNIDNFLLTFYLRLKNCPFSPIHKA